MSMSEDSKRKTEMINMTKQPWFNAAYKSALIFYEKDSQLDSKDRLELSKTYRNIANAQLYGGWLGFSAGFLPPFFWKFYKTNSVKGVNVPRNFILSLILMMLSSNFSSNSFYRKKMNELDPAGTFQNGNPYGSDMGDENVKSNAQKQWEMMQVLGNGGSTKWAAYFYLTFQNPERRLPDPKEKLKKMVEGQEEIKPHGLLQNRDLLGLYSGPEAERRRREGINEGQKQEDQPTKSSWESIREKNSVTGENSSSNGLGSSWNKLRERNLSQEKQQNEQDEPEFDEDSDPFAVLDRPSQSEFDKMVERERKGSDN